MGNVKAMSVRSERAVPSSPALLGAIVYDCFPSKPASGRRGRVWKVCVPKSCPSIPHNYPPTPAQAGALGQRSRPSSTSRHRCQLALAMRALFRPLIPTQSKPLSRTRERGWGEGKMGNVKALSVRSERAVPSSPALLGAIVYDCFPSKPASGRRGREGWIHALNPASIPAPRNRVSLHPISS